MKNEWILGINPCIYGMNYHDPSASLFKNNKLICAIEEERLNREKGSKGIFPIKAIKKCCEISKIKLNDIDLISVGYNPEKRDNRINLEFFKIFNNLKLAEKLDNINEGKKYTKDEIRNFSNKVVISINNMNKKMDLSSQLRASSKILNEIGMEKKVVFHDHHLCHAASAYYPSGFRKSLIIVIDGVGEFESLSIWKGINKKITKLENKTLPYSLGYLYAAFTSFLGFTPWNSEGKTMALAPYGKLKHKIIKKIDNLKDNLIINSFGEDLDLDLDKALKIIEKELKIKRREKREKIKNIHKDVAYAIQYYLEKEVSLLIRKAIKKYKINNICCSGGVFLNCKMNGVLREIKEINNSYFQPVSKDSGLSIGAALLNIDNPNKFTLNHLGLGESFSEEEIEKVLKMNKEDYRKFNLKDDFFFKYIAKMISNKKIVFWFNGGTEFGPRALGFRSILVDPRDKKLSDFINKNIKHREKWRPFACSILLDESKNVLLNFKRESPFMIEAYKVKHNWIKKIPGVIHVADGTTRPQTVNKNFLKRYYKLIREFFKITKIPLLLNTSLNNKGEPIINTPEEALSFFHASLADMLVINNYIIKK